MPCDTAVVIDTAYRAAELPALLRAARALGWRIVSATPTEVRLGSPTGAPVTVSPGKVVCPPVAEPAVGKLMQAYAREVFLSWVEDYPDRYALSQTESANEMVVEITASGRYGG